MGFVQVHSRDDEFGNKVSLQATEVSQGEDVAHFVPFERREEYWSLEVKCGVCITSRGRIPKVIVRVVERMRRGEGDDEGITESASEALKKNADKIWPFIFNEYEKDKRKRKSVSG